MALQKMKKGRRVSPFFVPYLRTMDRHVLIAPPLFVRIIDRLAHQLLEDPDFDRLALVGIQPRGGLLAQRIAARLNRLHPDYPVPCGALDVTFHRDDFRRKDHPLAPSENDMPFLVEDRRVILVDDVLYTGRTVRAAMEALLSFGRPASVQLLVLIDRRFHRELPIEPQFVGLTVDSIDAQFVRVHWSEDGSADEVELLHAKPL
jgi:pyrimidine operon attenuation protein/uracil phosphoribosyltransferase